MKLDKIFLASCTAMVLAGCTQEVVPGVEPTPGKDVVFGTSLEASKGTRTIYGPEDKTDNNFPILWVNKDQVKVMSPQCSRDTATYQVNITDATGQAPHAGVLTKVGDAGIQWGNDPTADFFSVYPAQHVTAMNPSARTIKGHLIHQQNDYLHNTGNGYTALADMNAGFLYASTLNAKNGDSVNLRYNPISTALRFTLTGPSADNNDAVTISYVRLTAPRVIAGDFTMTFQDDGTPTITTASAGETGYNFITVFSSYEGSEGGGYLTLRRGQSIELNAFILLDKEGVNITNEWTIEVVLSTGVTFKKALGGTAADGKSLTLVPGQIHRLPALPALNIPANQQTYDPANWMVNIPRNTYLSEISIPGSWNSLNSEFQSNTDLGAQYKAGVRAFHLDARYNATRTRTGLNPRYTYNITNLGVATGGSNNTYDATVTGNVSKEGKVMIDNGDQTPTFAGCLKTITDNVNAQEYMVVFVTWAQNSATKNGETWEKAVSDVCASNATVIDASTINENTTVGDVLGKVIVIVNTEGTTPEISGSKCFFVNAPLSLKKNMFGSGVYGHDALHYGSTAPSGITLLTSQCQVEFKNLGDFLGTGYNSQGNDDSDRGYLPTPAERQTQLNDIMTWSKNNFDGSKPNNPSGNWIYLGLGGYAGAYSTVAGIPTGGVRAGDGTYADIASTYNTWINGIINNMSGTPDASQGQTRYYPVGIVLMNFVTDTTYGTPVVNNILQLNNRFQKGYDKGKPAFPDQTNGQSNVRRKSFSSFAEKGGDVWSIE